jgi:hypothetical protein
LSDTAQAVFISYASQDADAASRICQALRAAGIEVWFDQSELRGGDAWDQKIRHEIRDCVIFIPVISVNTVARAEGYFRLEWSLAEQRSHMIARNKAFIVPVCLDHTPDSAADVPELFQRVQWTRLHGGDMTPAFLQRIATRYRLTHARAESRRAFGTFNRGRARARCGNRGQRQCAETGDPFRARRRRHPHCIRDHWERLSSGKRRPLARTPRI